MSDEKSAAPPEPRCGWCGKPANECGCKLLPETPSPPADATIFFKNGAWYGLPGKAEPPPAAGPIRGFVEIGPGNTLVAGTTFRANPPTEEQAGNSVQPGIEAGRGAPTRAEEIAQALGDAGLLKDDGIGFDLAPVMEIIAKGLHAAEEARRLAEQEIASLKTWVSDLQAGTWVNCVYCGHGAKHTLGPWTVYDQGKDDGPEYGCSIRSADPKADWVASDVYNRADAVIIAAALRLLAALKGMLEVYDAPCAATVEAYAAISEAEAAPKEGGHRE